MSTQQPCALLFIVEILRNDLISLDRVRFFYLSVKSERDSILITTNFRLTSIAVHIADGHLPPLSLSLAHRSGQLDYEQLAFVRLGMASFVHFHSDRKSVV